MSQHASAAPGRGLGPPRIRLPNARSVFLDRTRRFRELAQRTSSISGYLNLLGDLAEAQHEFAQATSVFPNGYPPGSRAPADQSLWRDEPGWHDTARGLANRISSSPAIEVPWLAGFSEVPSELLDDWAGRLLVGDLNHLDSGKAILIAGALQVHRTVAASRSGTEQRDSGKLDSNCPVCGFLPVSSLIQASGAVQGLRYLVCGLCATEWNRPRIQCVQCGFSKDVGYFGIDGAGFAVKAEACAGCRTYIKLLNREKDTQLDPLADDVANLSLDLLTAEEGYQRFGFNPLLIPGQTDHAGPENRNHKLVR